MAIIFPDPSPTGPTAISNIKMELIKVIKLTFADFVVGSIASVKAVLPADATILSMSYWKKTQFSGNSVSAAVLSIGIPGGATFASNFDVFTPAAGSTGPITPLTNIMQPYNLPLGPDIQLSFAGGSATGNPTAGEMYVTIRYVR